jgi:outer membrane protein TolC
VDLRYAKGKIAIMPLKKSIYIVLFLLISLASARAQVVLNSLEEVWKYADTHNITILAAKYEVGKSDYAKRQSLSALLPQATANGSVTDNTVLNTTLIPASAFGGPTDSFFKARFGTKYIYTGSITAQMDILNLQNWFNLRVAKYTYEHSKSSYANTRKTIYQQLATNYYSYLLMKEAEKLSEQNVLITDSVYQNANNKFQTGTTNEISVNTAKINLERSQANLITSRYQMLTTVNNLKQLLGLSVNDSLEITGTFKVDEDVSIVGTFQEDPSIALAYTQMKMDYGQYNAAKGAFVPTLNLSYYTASQQNDNKFEPFQKSESAPWYPAQYWQLKATFPIFTGLNRIWQVKRNKLAYEESKEQYQSAIKQSALNDENIRLSYQKAVAVLKKSEDVMHLAFSNYEHSSYRYEAGIAPVDDRLNAFSNYIDYQNQYLSNLSDMLVQLYQLKIRQQSF